MPASRVATTPTQVGKFVTFYRSPPGRETYEVGIADMPTVSGHERP